MLYGLPVGNQVDGLPPATISDGVVDRGSGGTRRYVKKLRRSNAIFCSCGRSVILFDHFVKNFMLYILVKAECLSIACVQILSVLKKHDIFKELKRSAKIYISPRISENTQEVRSCCEDLLYKLSRGKPG